MSRHWFWGASALLFSVLIYFSVDKLTESPPTWFDEGVIVQVAMNDSFGHGETLQTAPSIFVPATYVTSGFTFLKPISWSFTLHGIGLLQARAIMVVFIVACVAVFFALVYFLFGHSAALAALALIVTFPPLYGQGKNVLGEVPGLFYLAVFLLTLFKIEERKFQGAWPYVVAGIAAGLCIATKPIFILLAPAVAIAIVFRYRSIQFYWGHIGVGFISFVLPLLVWFFGRFSGSDSLSQLVSYYANPYAIENVNAQVLENIARFFHEAAPAYFALMMAAWVAALVLRIRVKEKIAIAETVLFVFALLVTAAYLRTEGWYRYFFLAEIPALVVMPFALRRIIDDVFMRKTAFGVWSCIMLFFLAVQCNQLLVGSWVAQHGERTTTHDMQEYMSTLSATSTFFVYNTPAAVIFLPNQNYYQYLELNPSVHLGTAEVTVIEKGVPDYIVTNDRVWWAASTTMPKYHLEKMIDSIVIASKK